MEQYMPLVWIGMAVVLGFFESITVQLVSIWFAIGSLCAAVTTLFTDNIAIQVSVFLAVSVIALIATRPLVTNWKNNRKVVYTNSDRLIGTTGVMLTDIDSLETTGQVKVGGEVWTAKISNAPVKKDNRVKILAIEGVKMIVEPQTQN